MGLLSLWGAGVRGTPVHSCLTNAFFFFFFLAPSSLRQRKTECGGSLAETSKDAGGENKLIALIICFTKNRGGKNGLAQICCYYIRNPEVNDFIKKGEKKKGSAPNQT